MTPKRAFLLVVKRRLRRNPSSFVSSDKAGADHLSEVAEGKIGVRPETKKETQTGTRIVEDSKENATVAG